MSTTLDDAPTSQDTGHVAESRVFDDVRSQLLALEQQAQHLAAQRDRVRAKARALADELVRREAEHLTVIGALVVELSGVEDRLAEEILRADEAAALGVALGNALRREQAAARKAERFTRVLVALREQAERERADQARAARGLQAHLDEANARVAGLLALLVEARGGVPAAAPSGPPTAPRRRRTGSRRRARGASRWSR